MTYLLRLVACLFFFVSLNSYAGVVIDVKESGDNLIFDYSGNIDLSSTLGLEHGNRYCSWCNRYDNQHNGYFRLASQMGSLLDDYNFEFTSMPDVSLISNNASTLTDGIILGDGFLFDASLNSISLYNQVWLENGYDGRQLSGNITFLNSNFSTIGLNEGVYTWTWESNGNSDFLTLNVNPVPLPAGIYLFLSGLIGLGWMRGRRSKQL